MVAGVLLLMICFCDHHQVSPVSADPEDVVEVGSSAEVSPVSADPEDVVEVLLGSSAELSCQLLLSPTVLNDSCISIQTKDSGEKSSSPLIVTDPEKKVTVTEQVLLYLYKGQEKPEHLSLMYVNRTRRLRGGDVGVEILSIAASDNNTIIQCVVCYGCWNCNIKKELILKVGERKDVNPSDKEENGNSTRKALAWIGGVVGIVIIGCIWIIRKRSRSANHNPRAVVTQHTQTGMSVITQPQ